MPKVVDNYILERKIGSGQFGEVFKGYNKVNNQDIAIKCVKRDLLKGKFTELLENEIKVLRTCNNDNIIKLYDIKKTANNIYLIMEYCNEGDLTQYLKTRKFLTEEEAVDYLLQILNGFKILVKHRIMHRDFKLANILKHDGQIKIADFGFSKLLGNEGFAQTMLGSPLNMAPEVLNNQEYDNKADIWSIGTVFYELLFGKPPFTATNMVDLLKNIQKNKFGICFNQLNKKVVNRKINNISPQAEDILKKMLIVDSKQRISWDDLFRHEIHSYQEDKIKKDLELTLKGDDMINNMSKFYIKNNMVENIYIYHKQKVIDHPAEIKKKEDLNNFAMQVARDGGKERQTNQQQQHYSGQIIRRPQEEGLEKRPDLQKQQSLEAKSSGPQEEQKVQNDGQLTDQETQRELEIRSKKRNANRILHERNIYVFLASVAEEAMNNSTIRNFDIAGFLLVKKLLQLIDFLKQSLAEKNNVYKLEFWEQFGLTKDYKDILIYISKEYDVFKVYFESMYEKILQNPKLKGGMIDEDVKLAINNNYKQNIDFVLQNVLKDYCRELVTMIQQKKTADQEQWRLLYVHADRIIDCITMEQTFVFEDKQSGRQFNFKQYYEEDSRMEIDLLQKKIMSKLATLKK